jgi:purine-nucleoside phosphorylase
LAQLVLRRGYAVEQKRVRKEPYRPAAMFLGCLRWVFCYNKSKNKIGDGENAWAGWVQRWAWLGGAGDAPVVPAGAPRQRSTPTRGKAGWDMTELYERVQESAAYIRQHWPHTPVAAIVLGTGLGSLASDISAQVVLPYDQIPHFPRSTAPSHKGQLVCGTLGGRPILAMEGRFHYYEGYTLQQITFPVRVFKALGASALLLTNAAGGLNPRFRKGDLMLIEDHINLMGDNPLIGPNDERLGERFPDMSQAYDRALRDRLQKLALEERIPLHGGVFVALAGPSLETAAEYRFLRTIGADAVGMSTVPEVIVAVHARLPVAALSVITDMCLPDALSPVSLPDILQVAQQAEPLLRRLITRLVTTLPAETAVSSPASDTSKS